MATIAGPRPVGPGSVGTLVDVTNSCAHTALKRSPRRYYKQSAYRSTPSLRDSYTKASKKAAQIQQVLIESSRLAVLYDLEMIIPSKSHMAPPGDQISRSGTLPLTLDNTVIATGNCPGVQGSERTESQSGLVNTPITPAKALPEKPLPPKPASRSQHTPERRGTFDATDLTAMSLNSRPRPLEPVSITEPAISDKRSPVSGSFHMTPSLLSRNLSSTSVSTGIIECGIASTKTIQSVKGAQVIVDKEHSSDVSSRKYKSNVSVSSRIPRRNYQLNNSRQSCGSPSRQSSYSGNKANLSMLDGRQATNARPGICDASQQDDILYDLSSASLTPDVLSERGRTKDVLEEHFTDENTHRTSSKYGYSIRESFEAREAIMGPSGPLKSRDSVGSLLKSRLASNKIDQNASSREFNLELATPDTRSELKEVNRQQKADSSRFSAFDKAIPNVEQSTTDQEALFGKSFKIRCPTHGQGPPSSKDCYPPRTSSLPSTPSPQQASSLGSKARMNIGSDGHTPLMPKIKLQGDSPGPGKGLPRSLRLSLFYRPTNASTSRASFNAKKINELRPSTSHIPKSRTLASLSEVRKGVKNLTKKVGKIIPGRRNTAFEATVDEVTITSREHIHGPHRQASHLLTTYKNSGMNEKSSGEVHSFMPMADIFTETEPIDRHEPEGTDKQKWIWKKGSRNVAYNAEAGHYTPFDQGAGDGYDEDEDEDRPPHRRGALSAPAHYVDFEDDDESGNDIGITAENGEVDDTHSSAEENTSYGHLPPTLSDNIIGTGAATGNITHLDSSTTENRFDSIIAETDSRARQLLDYAMSLQESRHRSLLVESANHLGQGIIHIRQARIQAVRVGQLLEETAVLLASNTQLLSLVIQQSSDSARAT